MLRAAPKGTASGVPLSAAEDRVLRAAFGRHGGRREARVAAARIVRHDQQLGPGKWLLCDCLRAQWLLCDCLRAAPHPPVLVLVSQTHIRRHEHTPWPPHLETCDFFREPAEQREITPSYRAQRRCCAWCVALMWFGRCRRGRSRVRTMRAGQGLARLLARLMTDAGLQEIGAGCRPHR
ncbi:MAG: hypothetical protein ABSC06_28675 [Rhodopila sp.]|jgi:hypothetical protein